MLLIIIKLTDNKLLHLSKILYLILIIYFNKSTNKLDYLNTIYYYYTLTIIMTVDEQNHLQTKIIDIELDLYFTYKHNTMKIRNTTVAISYNNIISEIIKYISREDLKQIHNILTKNNINIHKILNTTDEDGESILHYCVFVGNYHICSYLITKGCDTNISDITGQIPLHRVIFISNANIIPLLLNNGTIINTQDIEGNTALHLAVMGNNCIIVDCLLKYGANPYIKNNKNMNSIECSLFNTKIIDIFNKYIK
jgi:ankyrin repeat protein